MKLYLRINSSQPYQLMKMDGGEDISLNYSHDNLENPLNYVSEYAYNIKVPVCPDNNKIFNNFIHLDSSLVAGGYTPTNTIEYVILDNGGTLISTGTAYIKNIAGGYYNMALTGSLAKIFTTLLNAGYNTTKAANDSQYKLMNDWLKRSKSGAVFTPATNVINKDIVLASWAIDSPIFSMSELMTSNLRQRYNISSRTGLASVTETMCWLSSFIGFAPTAQGRLNEFANQKWMEGGMVGGIAHGTLAALPVLCSNRDAQGEPVDPVDVGDGLVEGQMGEYRSYYQQPYIYVNKLWQLFQRECKAMTGYDMQLDSRWFNADNAFLNNLVYMLPKLYDEESTEVLSRGTVQGRATGYALPNVTRADDAYPFTVSGLNATHTLAPFSTVSNANGDKIRYTFNASVSVYSFDIEPTAYHSQYNFIALDVAVRDTAHTYNGDPAVMGRKKYLLVPIPADGKWSLDDIYKDAISAGELRKAIAQGYKVVECKYANDGKPGTWDIVNFEDSIEVTNTRSFLPADASPATTQIIAYARYYNNYTPFAHVRSGALKYFYGGSPSIFVKLADIAWAKVKANRTDKEVSFETLFRDINPFSILLKYAKLAHLVWAVDDTEKVVRVKQSSDYFADCFDNGNGFLDITKIVDTSTGMEIRPLSWSDARVQFNLEDADLDYVEGYADRYGITYGGKTLITSNKTSASTKQLLGSGENDTIAPSILVSERLVPVGTINTSANTDIGYVDNAPMILNTTDGESANQYGAFFFRHANGQWRDILLSGWRYDGQTFVYITDDLEEEASMGEYMWHGPDALDTYHSNSWVKSYRMPVFDTMTADGSLSLHFAAVRELYYNAQRTPSTYLYDANWKDYIEEVYDANNKTVQLYAVLNKRTFDTLKINPLVKISNCIYLCTSIEGWGEHQNKARLTLRQINDLSKLTGGALVTIPEGDIIISEDGEYIITENNQFIIQE